MTFDSETKLAWSHAQTPPSEERVGSGHETKLAWSHAQTPPSEERVGSGNETKACTVYMLLRGVAGGVTSNYDSTNSLKTAHSKSIWVTSTTF